MVFETCQKSPNIYIYIYIYIYRERERNLSDESESSSSESKESFFDAAMPRATNIENEGKREGQIGGEI